MKENFSTQVTGHVQIFNNETGELLLDKKNAIHSKNMAIAIARGLSNSPNFQIFKIKLGNQGTYINSSQQIVFRPPNTTGDTANLYNPTYAEVVDDADATVGTGNSVTYSVVPGTVSTRVIMTAIVSASEAVNRATDQADTATPNADPAIDGTIDPEGEFFFDELGLFTRQTSGTLLNGPGELLLTHLIFSPIESTANREITIVYSLTITVS